MWLPQIGARWMMFEEPAPRAAGPDVVPESCPIWVPDLGRPTHCFYCCAPKDEHSDAAIRRGEPVPVKKS